MRVSPSTQGMHRSFAPTSNMPLYGRGMMTYPPGPKVLLSPPRDRVQQNFFAAQPVGMGGIPVASAIPPPPFSLSPVATGLQPIYSVAQPTARTYGASSASPSFIASTIAPQRYPPQQAAPVASSALPAKILYIDINGNCKVMIRGTTGMFVHEAADPRNRQAAVVSSADHYVQRVYGSYGATPMSAASRPATVSPSTQYAQVQQPAAGTYGQSREVSAAVAAPGPPEPKGPIFAMYFDQASGTWPLATEADLNGVNYDEYYVITASGLRELMEWENPTDSIIDVMHMVSIVVAMVKPAFLKVGYEEGLGRWHVMQQLLSSEDPDVSSTGDTYLDFLCSLADIDPSRMSEYTARSIGEFLDSHPEIQVDVVGRDSAIAANLLYWVEVVYSKGSGR